MKKNIKKVYNIMKKRLAVIKKIFHIKKIFIRNSFYWMGCSNYDRRASIN